MAKNSLSKKKKRTTTVQGNQDTEGNLKRLKGTEHSPGVTCYNFLSVIFAGYVEKTCADKELGWAVANNKPHTRSFADGIYSCADVIVAAKTETSYIGSKLHATFEGLGALSKPLSVFPFRDLGIHVSQAICMRDVLHDMVATGALLVPAMVEHMLITECAFGLVGVASYYLFAFHGLRNVRVEDDAMVNQAMQDYVRAHKIDVAEKAKGLDALVKAGAADYYILVAGPLGEYFAVKIEGSANVDVVCSQRGWSKVGDNPVKYDMVAWTDAKWTPNPEIVVQPWHPGCCVAPERRGSYEATAAFGNAPAGVTFHNLADGLGLALFFALQYARLGAVDVYLQTKSLSAFVKKFVEPAQGAAKLILQDPLSGKNKGCKGSGVLGARAFGIVEVPTGKSVLDAGAKLFCGRTDVWDTFQWRKATCGLAAVSGKPGFYECTKTPADVGMAAYKAYFKDTFSKIITDGDVARIRAEIESRDKENSSGPVAKKARK